jgi:hypothetical protein
LNHKQVITRGPEIQVSVQADNNGYRGVHILEVILMNMIPKNTEETRMLVLEPNILDN